MLLYLTNILNFEVVYIFVYLLNVFEDSLFFLFFTTSLIRRTVVVLGLQLTFVVFNYMFRYYPPVAFPINDLFTWLGTSHSLVIASFLSKERYCIWLCAIGRIVDCSFLCYDCYPLSDCDAMGNCKTETMSNSLVKSEQYMVLLLQ